jgi:hypothetical protein
MVKMIILGRVVARELNFSGLGFSQVNRKECDRGQGIYAKE